MDKNYKTFDEVRQEQIAFGQSWNLAVAIVAPSHIGKSSDNLKKDIEEWQKYFYDRLVNRAVKKEEKIDIGLNKRMSKVERKEKTLEFRDEFPNDYKEEQI